MAADILFKTTLDFQIEQELQNEDDNTITIDDIGKIDLHNATFFQFQMAMQFVKENYPDYYFSDATVKALNPSGSAPEERHDFIEIADNARIMAVNIGNMVLFNELQKIVSAEEIIQYNRNDGGDIDEERVFSINSIFSMSTQVDATSYEILGNCIVGMGEFDPYKIAAIKHADSTPQSPRVLLQTYSLNQNEYLPGIDIIDLNSIDKSEATLMEAFAYMSYQDYIKGTKKQSFDELLSSGNLGVVSLNDMTTKHIDLTRI